MNHSIFDPIIIDRPELKIRTMNFTSWEKIADGILYENSFHSLNWNLKTKEDIKILYDRSLKAFEHKKGHPIVYLSPDESEVYGITNFMNIEEPHLMTEIGGTWIGLRWQKTNINTITKYELIKYLVEKLNYKRIEFRIDIDNKNSQRAIERIGAKFEGAQRKRRINATGQSRDYCFYSIIDSDWPELKPNLEKLISSNTKTSASKNNILHNKYSNNLLSHIEINVSNYESSISFYDKVLIPLGWIQLTTNSSCTAYSDGHMKFILSPTDEKFKSNVFHRKNTGLNHLAFKALSIEQLDHFYSEVLLKNNINCLYEKKPSGDKTYYAVYIEDPDRIKIEIVFSPDYCDPNHWTNIL